MEADMCDVTTLVQRIQAEYREMPGLSLTRAQAQRVWQLDELRCDAVLAALVDARFLTTTRHDAFVRVA